MQPYTLAAASLEGIAWREVTKRASGAVVLAGVIAGGIFAIVAAVVGPSSELGAALLVIAVLAPGLALQQFWRTASFAASRAKTAAANDGYWAIGQTVAFGFLLWHGHVTVAESLVAWGAGAWLAAGLGILQLSVLPRVDLEAVRWARRWSVVGAWFAVASTTYTVGTLVVIIVIAAKTGSAGLGLFQTVQNLFGPISLFTIGAQSVFEPHLVRITKATNASGLHEARLFSLLLAASVTIYGVVLLLAARIVLTRVFGAAFAPAVILVLPTFLSFVLDAVSFGPMLQLRARAKGLQLSLAQAAATLTRVAAVTELAILGGLRGAAWGLVIGSGVGVIASWTLASATDRPHGGQSGARVTA
jgi:O-antigen/teichoic acid export membrane protein